jgi:DNA primase
VSRRNDRAIDDRAIDDRAIDYRAIDYRAIRERISIRQVLALVGYEPASQRGPQWRGPCPICHAGITTAKEHRFSVNVDRGLFQCFRCGRRGNQLDLWSQLSGLSLKPATVDLCHRLGIEPIRLNNPQPRPRP